MTGGWYGPPGLGHDRMRLQAEVEATAYSGVAGSVLEVVTYAHEKHRPRGVEERRRRIVTDDGVSQECQHRDGDHAVRGGTARPPDGGDVVAVARKLLAELFLHRLDDDVKKGSQAFIWDLRRSTLAWLTPSTTAKLATASEALGLTWGVGDRSKPSRMNAEEGEAGEKASSRSFLKRRVRSLFPVKPLLPFAATQKAVRLDEQGGHVVPRNEEKCHCR